MKIQEDDSGRSTVLLDDDDYVFIINIKDRHSVIHWPTNKQPNSDIIKLLYHLTHVNMKVNDKAMTLGLTNEDIQIVMAEAYKDYVAEENSVIDKTKKEEIKDYDGCVITSGNETVH